MDLPKGFVEDDKRVYDVLANEKHLPIDRIILAWKVYTTTNKKLQDPTARRLENFWWHIMGSDKRHLSPKTIADLWEQIACGPTFVPLKGPPNRYEPPPPVETRSNSQHDEDVLPVPGGLPKAIPELSETVAPPTIKELSASSSRPPPPHPILKKSRGDSKSGPRPTARFASPPDSEDEGSKTSEDNSSGSTAVGGLEMRKAADVSPAKSAKRRAGVPAKRFVATTASKRRPVLPRRPSSQSSTGSSELTSRHGGSSAGSRPGSQVGSLTSNPEPEDSELRFDSAPDRTPPLSAKALGKQPAARPSAPNLGQLDRHAKPAAESLKSPVRSSYHSTQSGLHPVQEGKQYDEYAKGQESAQPEPTSAPQAETASSLGAAATGRAGMERSSSHTEQQRPRQTSIGRVSSYGLLSSATSSTSKVAAYGQVSATDDPDLEALHARAARPQHPNMTSMSRNSSTASFFSPTVASPTPSVPLARPRSQLSLLLEKDSAKGRPPLNARSRS